MPRQTPAREPFVVDAANAGFVNGSAAHPADIPGNATRRMGLLIVAVLFLVPLYLFGTVLREVWAYYDTQRNGVAAQALIVTATLGSGPGRYAVTTYDYEVGGRTYQRTELITAAQLARLRVGALEPVRYLPGEPTIAYLPDSVPPTEPLVIYFCILVFFGLPLWRSIDQVRRDRALQRTGRLVIGSVVSCTQVPLRFRPIFDLRYKFTSPGGTEQHGTFRLAAAPGVPGSLPAPGDPIAVTYVDQRTHHLL